MNAIPKASGSDVVALMKEISSINELSQMPKILIADVFAHLFTTYENLTTYTELGEVELIIGEPKYMATLVSNVFGGSPDEYVGGFGFYTYGSAATNLKKFIWEALDLRGKKRGTESGT